MPDASVFIGLSIAVSLLSIAIATGNINKRLGILLSNPVEVKAVYPDDDTTFEGTTYEMEREADAFALAASEYYLDDEVLEAELVSEAEEYALDEEDARVEMLRAALCYTYITGATVMVSVEDFDAVFEYDQVLQDDTLNDEVVVTVYQ